VEDAKLQAKSDAAISSSELSVVAAFQTLPLFWRCYFLGLSLMAFFVAVADAQFRDNWPAGDWLINYAGGFVRRGLAGEIFLWLGSTSHLPAVLFVVPLEVGCYTIIYATAAFLMRRSEFPMWTVALLVSPAGLLFPVVNATAGNHKEILLFAVLAILMLALSRGAASEWKFTVFLSVACVVLVLTHEGLIFYLPYLFVGLVPTFGLKRACRICAVPICVSLLCAIVCSRYLGTEEIVRAISTSLGYTFGSGTLDVPDSIKYLAHSAPQLAHKDVLRTIIVDSYLPRFYWLGALSVAPILMGIAALSKHRTLRTSVWIFAAVAVLSSAATSFLFYYGEDWDRWIYIHVMCCTLLLLYLASTKQKGLDAVTRRKSYLSLSMLPATIGLLLYATTWTLSEFPAAYPFWGTGHFVKHWLTSPKPPLPVPPRK
jgi:hypothetical protein